MKPERAPESAPPPLRCPFCREGFAHGSSSIACGGCLATHHAACWEEGGWCCAACGDQACLGLRRNPGVPPKPTRNRSTPALCVLVVTLGCAVVVLLQRQPPLHATSPAPPLARIVPLEPVLGTPLEPVLGTPIKLWGADAHPLAAAQWALATQEWKLALSLFDEALVTGDANPAPLWVARAQVLRELGEPERALNHLNSALDARPAHHDWRLLRGDVHLELGNAPSALEDYQRALLDSGRAMPRVELLVAALERRQSESGDR